MTADPIPSPLSPEPEPYASHAWDLALGDHPDADPGDDVVGLALVTWTVLLAFNPPDDDAAFVSIIADAIERAAHYIEAQPCTCPPDDGPCGRCGALGRYHDERMDR